jgi:hypothetical protein
MAVPFNLSKDLLPFSNDRTFLYFLSLWYERLWSAIDFRFLAICGPLPCESSHYETTRSQLYLFDRLEELVLENRTPLPNEEVESHLWVT